MLGPGPAAANVVRMNEYDEFKRRCEQNLSKNILAAVLTCMKEVFVISDGKAEKRYFMWKGDPVHDLSDQGTIGYFRAKVLVTSPQLGGGHLEFEVNSGRACYDQKSREVGVEAFWNRGKVDDNVTVTFVSKSGRHRRVVTAAELRQELPR